MHICTTAVLKRLLERTVRTMLSSALTLIATGIAISSLASAPAAANTPADDARNDQIAAQLCNDNGVAQAAKAKLDAWVATFLPDYFATDGQRFEYRSSVSNSGVDTMASSNRRGWVDATDRKVVFCRLTFSAKVFSGPTFANMNGRLDPLEFSDVPVVIDLSDGNTAPVMLDLPAPTAPLFALTPPEVRLLASMAFRGIHVYTFNSAGQLVANRVRRAR